MVVAVVLELLLLLVPFGSLYLRYCCCIFVVAAVVFAPAFAAAVIGGSDGDNQSDLAHLSQSSLMPPSFRRFCKTTNTILGTHTPARERSRTKE